MAVFDKTHLLKTVMNLWFLVFLGFWNLSEKRLSLETNLADSHFLAQIFANISRNALCVLDYTDLSYIVGMRLFAVLCPLSPPCFGLFLLARPKFLERGEFFYRREFVGFDRYTSGYFY